MGWGSPAARKTLYLYSSLLICVHLWPRFFFRRDDQLAVARTGRFREGDEGFGDGLRRWQALRLLSGIGAGAQGGAQAAGIEEVDADLGVGDLVGIDP